MRGLGEGTVSLLLEGVDVGVRVGADGVGLAARGSNAVSVVGIKPSAATSSRLPKRHPNFATLVLFPAKY